MQFTMFHLLLFCWGKWTHAKTSIVETSTMFYIYLKGTEIVNVWLTPHKHGEGARGNNYRLWYFCNEKGRLGVLRAYFFLCYVINPIISHWFMNTYNDRESVQHPPPSLSCPSHDHYGYVFSLTRQLCLQGYEEDLKSPKCLAFSLCIWGFCWCCLGIWCFHSEINVHFLAFSVTGFLSHNLEV